MTFNKTITIAIPVFERFDYFPEAIASAINQSVKCEILVVDNCSSHNRFKEYLNKLDLGFIRYYRNSSVLPMIENWNECLNLCATEWVSILHDDDLLHPRFIEHVSELIKRYSDSTTFMVSYEVGEVPKNFLNHNETNFSVKNIKKIFPENFIFGNVTAFPGVVINLHKIKQTRFDVSSFPIQDYDLWYRLSLFQPIIFSNALLAFYRVSPNQASAGIHTLLIESAYTYIRERIKFRNKVYKFFAMWVLYGTHLGHKKIYSNRWLNEGYKYKFEELNKYFHFFSNRAISVIMPFISHVFRKLNAVFLSIKYH